MIIAHHICFSAYGFWLPNDPRGSGSDHVGAKHLLPFSSATKVEDRRRSRASNAHDREQRYAAKRALQRTSVKFTGIQARAVGRGFACYAERSGLTIWACSILPEHVHLVVEAFRIDADQIAIQLKGAAARRLMEENLHPFREMVELGKRPPPCWGRSAWNVFLDDDAAVRRCIRYVDENPEKEGKPRQSWWFVEPYKPR